MDGLELNCIDLAGLRLSSGGLKGGCHHATVLYNTNFIVYSNYIPTPFLHPLGSPITAAFGSLDEGISSSMQEDLAPGDRLVTQPSLLPPCFHVPSPASLTSQISLSK